MTSVSLRELLEAGAHFGHQTKRWNPKMRPYIFGARNGIYIIDLQKTVRLFKVALEFIRSVSAGGGKVLFVGTKPQAQAIIREESQRVGMPFVTQRWLGGTLTNFATIKKSIARLLDLESMKADGTFELLAKKEGVRREKNRARLDKFLGGIKTMEGLPKALFVVDTRHEHIAVREAVKLGIPVVAMVDTNANPEGVEYILPGNDDALRSVRLFISRVADAVEEGQTARKDSGAEDLEAVMAAGDTAAAEILVSAGAGKTEEKTEEKPKKAEEAAETPKAE